MKYLLPLFFLASSWLLPSFSHAQQPTPAAERLEAFRQRQKLIETSLVNDLPFRSIGPTVMSGRVADIEVNPKDPTEFYVAYASGGLWHTTDNGISFEPLFDAEAVMTIGDIAVNWQHQQIWVGTGEVNASRSSYAGTGLYLSTDGGKTWQHRGLPESHHIGRILIDENNPHTLWVAVLGHLYSPNKQRGIYKTTDGGKTWQKTLYVNDETGAIDLLRDPNNPHTLYAATWQRSRKAWDFRESGPGSAIYRSTDAGQTWKKISGKRSGFPSGEGVGRIGLAAATDANGQTILYAILDNNFRRPKQDKPIHEGLTKEQLRNISVEDFLLLDTATLQAYLKKHQFPEKYSAAKVFELVRRGEILPIALVEYIEDANARLFDTPVIGAEVYVSYNGGKSWEKTHEGYLDDLYYSYGYYFGQIRTQADDPDKLYIFGVPILRSEDGGKSWTSINGDNVHVDHHALWVNPNRPGHLILGNDGGINISYDDGKHWLKCNTPPVGQFYTVAVDYNTPYNVFGGLQDNGVWRGPSTYQASVAWYQTGHYPYKMIMGGDGMQIAVDIRDNNTVYTGFQFGNYFRINLQTEEQTFITPKHELGERPLRWNWQTPIHLSAHNPDILYMGANRLYRSLNRGEDFEAISPDLTGGGKPGDVPFGTLTAIHESPLQFGLLYTGSDDGKVYVSRNGGYEWENLNTGLPEGLWVSRIQASAHKEERVYLSLNGYRNDYFEALIYRSDNYGKNWQRIGLNLPAEPVNVIREDPENDQLIYVGTDHGLYVSLDGGVHFQAMMKNLPHAPVHDLVVHPRDKELVVATHGRSLFVADVSNLQLLTSELLTSELHLFEIPPLSHNSNWGKNWSKWLEAQEPEVKIPYYLRKAGKVEIGIYTSGGIELFKQETRQKAGLHEWIYNLSIPEEQLEVYRREMGDAASELEAADNGKYYLLPGEYLIRLSANGVAVQGSFRIRE